MKLRRRIHLYSTALFAMLLIAANVTVYQVFSHMTIERELDQMTAETMQASESIRAATSRPATEALLRAYAPLDGMLRIVKEGEKGEGQFITSSSAALLGEIRASFYPQRQVDQSTIAGKSYGFVSIPYIHADGDVVNIQATVSMEDAMQILRMLRIVLISVSAVVMIPVIISSVVLGRIIMNPIAAMTTTMREIIRSNKFMRLKRQADSHDELGKMGDTFNEMIGMLESSFMKQEQFVSNASHELRTPLTIIESYASLLKRRGQDRPELFEESVEAIHSEAVRMKALTEQLLWLAKPHRQWELSLESVDIYQMLDQIASNFQRAYNRVIHVESSAAQSLHIDTDIDKLKQLVFILLDNARKYSQEDISIVVGEEQGRCLIQVKDHGIGIAADELPYVFDRFYRVDKARTRDEDQVGGSGLGLSLAKEISEAIGAVIEIESEEHVGTTVKILLPHRPNVS